MGNRILNYTESMPASGDLTDTRIRYAFRLCLAREPNDREATIVRRLYESVLTMPAAEGQETTSPEQRACTAMARTMLNLDEFVTRE